MSIDDLLGMQKACAQKLCLSNEIFFMHRTMEMILHQAIKTKRKEMDFPKCTSGGCFKPKI